MVGSEENLVMPGGTAHGVHAETKDLLAVHIFHVETTVC